MDQAIPRGILRNITRGVLHNKAAEQNKCVKVSNLQTLLGSAGAGHEGPSWVSDPKRATDPKFTHSTLVIELNV